MMQKKVATLLLINLSLIDCHNYEMVKTNTISNRCEGFEQQQGISTKIQCTLKCRIQSSIPLWQNSNCYCVSNHCKLDEKQYGNGLLFVPLTNAITEMVNKFIVDRNNFTLNLIIFVINIKLHCYFY